MPPKIRVVQTIAFTPVQPMPFVEWSKKLQYVWWWDIIMTYWGSAINWRYWKNSTSPEDQREIYRDIVELYCMGGEL